MTDIEIAQSVKMRPITEIAEKLGIREEDLEQYGKYRAKIMSRVLREKADDPDGKLILVTALTPTAAGEGKTTISVGLADGLARIGKKVCAALREPSMGPLFGVKGGATGGGYSQLVPMEEINLHFNGDIHAITAANNLLAAMVDNSIYQGNKLNMDPRRICWKRCMDVNDRQLRNVIDGLGGPGKGGCPREDGFDITAASEIMAVLCLARDMEDLKKRLSRLIVGYTYGKGADRKAVTAGDLHAEGAMAVLLRDAMNPNLVQTLEHTPAILHGGPFANIAHGCNSINATKMALKLADFCVTEAGFGGDLGAEKFFDIKCRAAGLRPNAVVVVATVRALKMHGGLAAGELQAENLEALTRGLPNLLQHVANIREVFGLPCVVALNVFPTDTEREIALVQEELEKCHVKAIPSEAWAKGGEGSRELAEAVLGLCEEPADFRFCYELSDSIEEKLNALVHRIYHGRKLILTAEAERKLREIKERGLSQLPICVAKTQFSFSDDPKKRGVPRDFDITVRSLRICQGAGFIVALTGNIMTMPGLPRVPAAEQIDITSDGVIAGLF